MSAIVAIASGKGGVGKTFVTAALAAVLARQGLRVLAVDADMGLRNLDLAFGVQDEVLYDMGDVLKKKCAPADAILSAAANLDFIAASQKHTWEKIDAPTYRYMVEKLSGKYDVTLIDCPPGRDKAYKNAVAIVDRILFVIEPTWASMRDTARLMQVCHKHKRFNYDILFNNFYRNDPGYVSAEEMIALLNPERMAGVLPHDPAAHEAAQHGRMAELPGDTPLFRALLETARYLTEGTAVSLDACLALLPEQEGRPDASHMEHAAETDTEETDANTERMKSLAAQELQRAAAVLAGSGAALPDEEDMPKPAGLSLRRRQQQSMAWRHYRR